MNSPVANIFLALQTQITTQVPSILYIDIDYDQLETADRPSVVFPCVLIDFLDWSFDDLTSLVQKGAGLIKLKLALNLYSSSTPCHHNQLIGA